MRTSKLFLALVISGITLASCGNNNDKTGADSTSGTSADSRSTDTIATDTSAVKPADSTHSYRNDRGTDSVTAGKSIPAQP